MAHTPLPWKVYEDEDELKSSYQPGIESANLSIVVIGYDFNSPDQGVQGKTTEEAWANAEFIVRACNSHYELLAACEALPDFDIENPDAADFKDNAASFMRAMKLARSAIAKAKGE